MTSKNTAPQTSPEIRWPFWFAGIFILIIAIGWIAEAPSREELFGDTGKLWDQLKTSIGGWTPNYMLGHSSAVYDSTAIAMFLSKASSVLFGWIAGAFLAQKLLILTFLPFAFWTMRLFLQRLGLGSGVGSLGALFYIVMPSMLVAIGIYEHWTVGLCFVFTPLILRESLPWRKNPRHGR